MTSVSIIVPCYNEEATIGLLLEAILNQTFPIQEMEVIVADGLSTDQTRQVIHDFQQAHPEICIRIVDNHQRIIPAALNRAIENTVGDYIIRLDAHSIPYPDYVEGCLKALKAGLGDNVGGIWEIRPFAVSGQKPDAVARGIASATMHPLGVGDALYRFSRQAQETDTVPFGAFHRTLPERIGGFEETLFTNEDYEFNVRVRQSGGKVWLDPAIRSVYFSRPTLNSLIRQYWRYGRWKAYMLKRYPKTIRWRQALPPLFVASLIGLALLAPWITLAGWCLLGLLVAYTIILVGAGLSVAWKNHDPALLATMPMAIATMHISWGSGLIWSVLEMTIKTITKRERKLSS